MKDLINDYVLSTWPHNHNIDGDDGVDDEEEEEEYRVSQKNWLIECCWSHGAQAQSSVACTPWA